MALATIRINASRLGGVHVLVSKPSLMESRLKMASICPIQVATLKCTHGIPTPRKPPFEPFNLKYNRLFQLLWIDRTSERFDDNSKVIIVEGNVGVGKQEFAKRLAKEFDMKFFPSIFDDKAFIDEFSGFDLRSVGQLLPKHLKAYGFKDLWLDPKPDHGLIGITQIHMYRQRYHYYREALHHLFKTGQGVVLTRSPYADLVFVEALCKMGCMSRQATKFFRESHRNSIGGLLTPHLTVYLDAPVSYCREKITERGRPEEQKSVALSDEFLETKRDLFLNKFVPTMRRSGEVYEVNCTRFNTSDDHDWELITDDLEELVLHKTDPEQFQYDDWDFEDDEEWFTFFRRSLGDKAQYDEILNFPVPFDAPELLVPQEDRDLYNEVVIKHPLNIYDKNFSPYRSTTRSLLMKTFA